MKNVQKLVTNVNISIDRIGFSIPLSDFGYFTLMFYKDAKQVKQNKSKNKKYQITKYKVLNTDVFISFKIQSFNDANWYERVYITVISPDAQIQEYFKTLFSCMPEIIINQVEVAYDIFFSDNKYLKPFNKFVEHHVLVKYLKAESRKKYITTIYIGRNGDVRKGPKGLRNYEKNENNQDFYRMEMQYNRPWLRKNNITINLFPLNPLSFRTFDHIEILDNFTKKGLHNISRTILRKKEIDKSSFNEAGEFNRLHRKEIQKLRTQILGGSRGGIRTVPKQLAKLKSIKKENKLSLNIKQAKYFPPHDAWQLITCLADTGYQEDYCSKRMVGCQVTR